MIAKRIRVYGKVQGVYFRATTKERADALRLTGWVRNEPDGTVLIEVEGSELAIDEFIGWCHEGPTSSKVSDIELEGITVQGFNTFEVRY